MSYDNRPMSPLKGQHEARFRQPDSQHSPRMTQSIPDLDQVQSRGSSIAPDGGYTSDSSRYSRARQPINEAVSSAFTATPAADTAIPPEVLAQLTSQITQNVIQQLKATSMSASTAAPESPRSEHPPPSSRLTDSSRHGNIVNTPPPNMPPPDAAASSTAGSPPPDRATVYTPPSPYRASEEAARTRASPGDRGSRAGDSDDKEDRPARPRGPQRISTGGDATIIERIWGALFTEQGESTLRLGQLLRGIAVHLIEDYEPKHSLVITPDKLQRYFEETKLDNEIYPWSVIFDDRTSSISRMFRELAAQHHLVQPHGKFEERPDVPGLTPQGFETWATLLIKAHPELEFERIVKTARDMPISNPDDKKERFPKEISRRLFPKHGDESIMGKLQKSMSVHCNVSFKARKDTVEETRSTGGANEAKPHLQSVPEQDQPAVTPVTSHDGQHGVPDRISKVFSHTDSGVVIDDEDDAPTPQPIERERKPYVSAPGGGKHFDDINAPAAEIKPATTEPKLARSLSNASRGEYPRPRPPPISVHQSKPTPSTPVDIPEPRRHRNSVYHKDQPSTSAPRRNRSPSVSKSNGYARRSEPDHGYGNSYNSVSSVDAAENSRRYRDYDTQREKHAGDRYDPARMAAYDPRERDRDSRPRTQSIATGSRAGYSAEDEYYRSIGGYPTPKSGTTTSSRDTYNTVPTPTSAQYPPNAYRESRAEPADSGFSRRTTTSSDVFTDFSKSQPR